MSRTPALFIAHGNPMFAIVDSEYTRAWREVGKSLSPTAIVCISAHWLTRGVRIMANEVPRIIYDFGGFPDELYQVQYPAKGSPALARKLNALLPGSTLDESWGLDHGSWAVLKRMFPDADVPVIQLSLDVNLNAKAHYELAKALKPLRDEGVLILGSGNIVHNLRMADFTNRTPVYNWANEFDSVAKDAILQHDHEKLISYELLGQAAHLSVPTPDHYWPLLYTLAVQDSEDAVTFPTEGMDLSSISMRSVRLG
ncbi:MAG: 4,5-DOPA dioxygenase extradiol [Leptospirales bacterium]|nr:4,5-DOPA dioxygenase extradiol [Leptospirales bacterium]